ncbi:MAG: PDDEXK nuclease domain-containing protein, partial [Bacteroidaceae bacterium]|nr:PDDEXK nuclease domain-containing protein [Bacteroidaceae bacterium]
KEGELEEAIEQNMSRFLLELGKGFAFYSRQYRISLAGRHLYVDLVFYNVILKCFVLIDLKRGEVKHEDIGQMNLYLNYFRHEVNREEDNEPIGIVLGASGDRLTMQYALEGISNQLFVSRYQLYLPSREQLEKEINKILNLSNQK